jgi:dienelactone hydrolase
MDHQDGGVRQFMVSAFYPASLQQVIPNARFIDIFEPAADEALEYLMADLQAEERMSLESSLRGVELRSLRDAAPDRSDNAAFPILIYYPGGGSNRLASADVCEGLASQGYVVFALDGPHDAELVVFPDGNLCKGPLKGDYISPGVGDIGYLISQLDNLNREGFLAGMIDTQKVGIFGHSRGGYIANISAFLYEPIGAAVSVDSFLWGYATKGTGLERHPKPFQAKVRSTSKPILRLCGRPAGADPQIEAAFCLERDGGDFIGDFTAVAFPGWSHGDFATTPWLCGKGKSILANQRQASTDRAETLVDILQAFFNIQLRGGVQHEFDAAVERHPELAAAKR